MVAEKVAKTNRAKSFISIYPLTSINNVESVIVSSSLTFMPFSFIYNTEPISFITITLKKNNTRDNDLQEYDKGRTGKRNEKSEELTIYIALDRRLVNVRQASVTLADCSAA